VRARFSGQADGSAAHRFLNSRVRRCPGGKAGAVSKIFGGKKHPAACPLYPQKQTLETQSGNVRFVPKADISGQSLNVRFRG